MKPCTEGEDNCMAIEITDTTPVTIRSETPRAIIKHIFDLRSFPYDSSIAEIIQEQ
jgi:hypothetical protein